MLPSSFRHTVPLHTLDLSEVVRMLRAMDERHQTLIVGIADGMIGLRGTQQQAEGFKAAWRALLPHEPLVLPAK